MFYYLIPERAKFKNDQSIEETKKKQGCLHLADFLSHLYLLDMLRGRVDEECERNKEAYVYMLEMERTNHDKSVEVKKKKLIKSMVMMCIHPILRLMISNRRQLEDDGPMRLL